MLKTDIGLSGHQEMDIRVSGYQGIRISGTKSQPDILVSRYPDFLITAFNVL